MHLWSSNNFIFWILHHSLSSAPVGTTVFSGKLLLWKGAHPVFRLAGILILLVFTSSLFVPSTSLSKTQNSSEEINSVYASHRRYAKYLCTSLGWNQSFIKRKLDQLSPTKQIGVFSSSWGGFATMQKWLVSIRYYWDVWKENSKRPKHFSKHPTDSWWGGGLGTSFTDGRESAEIQKDPAICRMHWHKLPAGYDFWFYASLRFSSLSSRFTVI